MWNASCLQYACAEADSISSAHNYANSVPSDFTVQEVVVIDHMESLCAACDHNGAEMSSNYRDYTDRLKDLFTYLYLI
jgi:hypothetical protein